MPLRIWKRVLWCVKPPPQKNKNICIFCFTITYAHGFWNTHIHPHFVFTSYWIFDPGIDHYYVQSYFGYFPTIYAYLWTIICIFICIFMRIICISMCHYMHNTGSYPYMLLLWVHYPVLQCCISSHFAALCSVICYYIVPHCLFRRLYQCLYLCCEVAFRQMKAVL